MLTTCWVACSLHGKTRRLDTIAAFRSSSSSTTPSSLQLLQGQLDHADRSLHDPHPRADHGAGLLLAQHGLGDLWSVGQPGQACLDDRHAGRLDPPIWAYLRLTFLIPHI